MKNLRFLETSNAANSFELLRNRDLMLQQWKYENQMKREAGKRRKTQFLLALQSFKPPKP